MFSESKKLNNGVEIPLLGLGVFQIPQGAKTAEAVRSALVSGYRHIDTAAIYGNEQDVGAGIRQSGVGREEIFLTTKLWNDDMRKGRMREAFFESLKKLQTDYVDLYLIHWPVAGRYMDSWRVLEELYAEGRVRAIGVSNFHKHHLEDILSIARVTPAVNQIERHPLLSQTPLIQYCEDLGIAIEAYSPLGGTGGTLLNNEVLQKIGKKYGKSPAQTVLRWNVQRGIIALPKSVHAERIQSNAEIGFILSEADMAAIDALNRDERVNADPDHFNF
ncbi:MAG TPA: aldo/keto reductase [Feifaniaceae bacterium]|nr:aldo/keto reductase [Feifaniaceae bacterium]